MSHHKHFCCSSDGCCKDGCCSSHDFSGCSSSCGCGCQEHSSCDKGKAFLDLADEAWMEVLKEKIKEHIRANDKHIQELAVIVSEANHARWKRKMEKEKCSQSYEEKLADLFCSCSSGHCDSKK